MSDDRLGPPAGVAEPRPAHAEPRILGIDPGSRALGWALLTGTASRPHMIDAGVIRPDRRSSFPDRLASIQEATEQLVRTLQPSSAAVETPFHGASPRAALQLAHARGVILAVLARAEIEVAEYTPAVVKQAVTGNGRADKTQVGHMVGRLLGRSHEKLPHDLWDAAATGLCHLGQIGFREAVARSTGTERRQ